MDNILVRHFSLLKHSKFSLSRKHAFPWRRPLWIYFSKHNHIQKVEYLKNDLIFCVYGSIIRFHRDFELNNGAVMSFASCSETSLEVERLLKLVETK